MENNKKLKVGISIGDMNGIGPEIILKTFNDKRIFEFCIPIIYCSLKNLNFFMSHFGFDVKKKFFVSYVLILIFFRGTVPSIESSYMRSLLSK